MARIFSGHAGEQAAGLHESSALTQLVSRPLDEARTIGARSGDKCAGRARSPV